MSGFELFGGKLNLINRQTSLRSKDIVITSLYEDAENLEEKKTHLFFHHKILDTITYHWKPYFLLLHLARDLIKAPLACYSERKM